MRGEGASVSSGLVGGGVGGGLSLSCWPSSVTDAFVAIVVSAAKVGKSSRCRLSCLEYVSKFRARIEFSVEVYRVAEAAGLTRTPTPTRTVVLERRRTTRDLDQEETRRHSNRRLGRQDMSDVTAVSALLRICVY